MKTKLMVLSAIIAAGTSLAIAAAVAPSVIAAKRKKHCDDFEDYDDEEGGRKYYTVPDSDEVSIMNDAELGFFEMNSGAIRTPESIRFEASNSGRAIVLKPNGSLEYYEDGELVGRDTVEAWPEGEFKIHAVYLRGVYWLFFEKFHTGCFDGISMEPGYYNMDYAVALNSSFKPLSLSKPKTLDKENRKNESFAVLSMPEQICIAEKVVLRVPDHVRSGDLDRTIEDFTYFGSEDGGAYVCKIDDTRAFPFLYAKEGFEVDLIDDYAVVDCKDCYMMYRWVSNNNITERYFKDCFGKHDFARFKRACSNLEVMMPFYDVCDSPKESVIE